jgi:hypothetical protein
VASPEGQRLRARLASQAHRSRAWRSEDQGAIEDTAIRLTHSRNPLLGLPSLGAEKRPIVRKAVIVPRAVAQMSRPRHEVSPRSGRGGILEWTSQLAELLTLPPSCVISRRRLAWSELLGSIPAAKAGCPTSRSFFARCGIPQASLSSRYGLTDLHGCPTRREQWREQ